MQALNDDDDDGTTFLPIADMDEWREFWDANGEAIGDEDIALRLAMNCALLVGGGAAPLFRVGFVD